MITNVVLLRNNTSYVATVAYLHTMHGKDDLNASPAERIPELSAGRFIGVAESATNRH